MGVTVTGVKSAPQPGVQIHELSNGWFVREDPRKGSHRFTLYKPGGKANDAKLLATANKLRKLLKAAAEIDGGGR